MMQQSYPGINPVISEWKGQEITDFQEELLQKVNAHISEKWFYTHMKGNNATLPRIDVLNLLSKYVGYANWDDLLFKTQLPGAASQTGKILPRVSVKKLSKNPDLYFILVPVLAVCFVFIFYGLFILFNTREYKFTFHDADTRESITGEKIEVVLMLEGESPVTGYSDTSGCFILETNQSKIKLIVSAPYYKADTIIRVLRKLDQNEIVSLHANDYALMIHYLSQAKVGDWEKRRSRLDEMIDDGAMICQVVNSKDAVGMELFTKKEFIDKITMPAGSLKNIEILDTRLKGGKINLLRFRVNQSDR